MEKGYTGNNGTRTLHLQSFLIKSLKPIFLYFVLLEFSSSGSGSATLAVGNVNCALLISASILRLILLF